MHKNTTHEHKQYTPDEPIAAVATALAPSALAVIRTSGKNAVSLVSSVFSRPAALICAAGNTIVYGWIIDPENGARVDEVLISVFRAPKSCTGEEMAEISCHGGVSTVTAVYSLLLNHGFRSAERGEFTFRSYIHGKTDLTRAEAVREIIEAKTGESRNRAAGRLAGSLYDEIENIKQKLISTLASIEAEIEYPEDEEAIADAFDKTQLIEACNDLKRLCSTWSNEKLYQDGARIILCGRTNAGKSSLFNMLLKEDRAIVSDIHGTTRDWIESWISFDGIPARLFDTAGLRLTEDVIEQRGVEMTIDLSRDADLLLYVIDSAEGAVQEDIDFIKNNAALGKPIIIVWNKADKVSSCNGQEIIFSSFHADENNGSGLSSVRVSAKTGEGTADLALCVKKQLLAGTSTERDQAGLGSLRQKQTADEALDSVKHALEAADSGFTLDAVVQDIEDALSFLGEITGRVTPEDILASIFSRFCVGK